MYEYFAYVYNKINTLIRIFFCLLLKYSFVSTVIVYLVTENIIINLS